MTTIKKTSPERILAKIKASEVVPCFLKGLGLGVATFFLGKLTAGLVNDASIIKNSIGNIAYSGSFSSALATTAALTTASAGIASVWQCAKGYIARKDALCVVNPEKLEQSKRRDSLKQELATIEEYIQNPELISQGILQSKRAQSRNYFRKILLALEPEKRPVCNKPQTLSARKRTANPTLQQSVKNSIERKVLPLLRSFRGGRSSVNKQQEIPKVM